MPTVTYATLPQFIYGVASTASKTFPTRRIAAFQFPESRSLCAGHLESDHEADVDLRHSRHVTIPIRSIRTMQVARLRGSFDSISHDVNQPLNAAIQTGLGNVFSLDAAGDPATENSHCVAVCTEDGAAQPASECSAIILPGSIVDLVGVNPPYSKTFQGGLAGHRGRHGDRAGSSEQRGRCDRRRQSDIQRRDFARASFPAHRRWRIRQPVFLRSPSRRCPDGKLHAPYFMEWSLGLEHQIGNTVNLRAQYVGTRAVNQPYLTQVNGYQTVCQGCFAPFPYRAADRSAIRGGHAIVHRREQPLQRPATDGR